MQIQEMLALYNSKDKKNLLSFIKEKHITEKQLLQIAKNTFKILETNPVSINNIQAQKMLLSLSFVINSNIQEIDPKGFENYKKILMKDGINVAKEVWAHYFLSKYFTDYHLVIPFLSHGQISNPDGVIKNDNEEIPVEIKVRNPKLLTYIDIFFSFVSDSIEEIFPKNRIIICNIILTKINKLDHSVLNEEKHDFLTMIEKLKSIQIPTYPHGFSAKRKSKNIEWTIEITSYNQEPKNEFFMPQKLVQNCIAYKGFTSLYNGQFYGSGHLTLTCTDEVKRILSEKIIKQCIKNAKNLPKRGLIVIFFDVLSNEYLNAFFEKIANEYVTKKPDLAILGLQDKFDSEKKRIIGRMLATGKNMETIIQKKSVN